MVHVYIGLTFILLVKVQQGYTANCGSLKFEQDTVTEGGFAKLIYTPHDVHASREWFREKPLRSIYKIDATSNNNKYVEVEQGSNFTLSILRVVQSDTGPYIVYCGQAYSDRATLTVTPAGDSQSDCGELTLVSTNLTEGQTATLQFSIRPGRVIKWEKKIKSTFQQVFKGTEYDITKNVDNTIHNLLICGSKYTDSGEYRVNCDTAAVSNSVHLKIVPTTPSVPAFSNVESIHDCEGCILAELNKPVKVECFVEGGTEPVELNMFKDANTIPDVNKSNSSKNGVNIYYARYNFIPTTAGFSVAFTCTVKNPALKAELAKSAPIYIRVDPETVAVNVQQAKENEASEIQCMTTKGRPPTKPLIYIDNIIQNKTETTNEIKTDHTYSVTTTMVNTFTRFHNQHKVMCCSVILTPYCTNTTNVNVLFPPKKVSVIEMMKINQDNGDTEVKLKCSVEESNPKSTVEWNGIIDITKTLKYSSYTDHNKTHGWTLSTICMFNLTKEDNGRSIRCEVKNPKFPTLGLVQIYRPNITYTPIITLSVHDNEAAYIGDDVLLTCHVDSNPPSSLSWHNQTNLIRESDGTKSLDLLLHNISLNHSQIYTCTALNNIGGIKTRSVSLLVKEKALSKAVSGSSSVSVTVPVVASAIVAVAAVIVIIALVTCRKKRQIANAGVKGSDQMQTEEKTADPGRNDTHNANKEALSAEDEVNEQREYESVEPDETEETHDYSETYYYDDVIEKPNTGSGIKFVRGKLDQNQYSGKTTKSLSRAQNEPTSSNVTVYVDVNLQEYESVTPKAEREETHTYSKLGGDEGNTNER